MHTKVPKLSLNLKFKFSMRVVIFKWGGGQTVLANSEVQVVHEESSLSCGGKAGGGSGVGKLTWLNLKSMFSMRSFTVGEGLVGGEVVSHPT